MVYDQCDVALQMAEHVMLRSCGDQEETRINKEGQIMVERKRINKKGQIS